MERPPVRKQIHAELAFWLATYFPCLQAWLDGCSLLNIEDGVVTKMKSASISTNGVLRVKLVHVSFLECDQISYR